MRVEPNEDGRRKGVLGRDEVLEGSPEEGPGWTGVPIDGRRLCLGKVGAVLPRELLADEAELVHEAGGATAGLGGAGGGGAGVGGGHEGGRPRGGPEDEVGLDAQVAWAEGPAVPGEGRQLRLAAAVREPGAEVVEEDGEGALGAEEGVGGARGVPQPELVGPRGRRLLGEPELGQGQAQEVVRRLPAVHGHQADLQQSPFPAHPVTVHKPSPAEISHFRALD